MSSIVDETIHSSYIHHKMKGGSHLSEKGHVTALQFNGEAVLMDKLSQQDTIEQLTKLLDRLEEFNAMFDMFEHFMQRGPEMADSLNRLIVMLREQGQGLDILSKLESSFQTLNRLQQFLYADEFKKLEENLLNDDMLKLMNSISRSITAASLEFEYGKRSEEHTSELQSRENLVCRLL